MRLGTRRAGTSTSFVDSELGEVLLKFSSDEDGNTKVAFCLYDEHGVLVTDSLGLQPYPEGLTVRDVMGETLLDLPARADGPVCYRLFNRTGRLLTWSDGSRTQIFAFLRMEHGMVEKTKPAQASGLKADSTFTFGART
jgi:hypothetical protein